MKRFLALILALMLVLSGCAEKPELTEPTDVTKYEDPAPDQPTVDATDPTVPLSERSDFELIEAAVGSDVCAAAYTGSYGYGTQEWIVYMMEHCEPFKELMFRETAIESLTHYAPLMVARYQQSFPKNVYGLTSLCDYLIPEQKPFLDRIVYSHSHNVIYEVNEEVQNAYEAYLDALTAETSEDAMARMHFEDSAAARKFAESYVSATEAEALIFDVANENDSEPLIYLMMAFVRTEQVPEGEFLSHFVAEMEGQYRIMPDITQVPPDLRKTVMIPEDLPFDWSGFKDQELLEQTIRSDAINSLLLSSYFYEGGELVQYVLESCSAFRALMDRDSGLDSLRDHAVSLVEAYRDEKPINATYFARLAVALIPELEGAGEYFTAPPTPLNWVIVEAYNNFVRTAMGGSVPLRYMHFEDAAAEKEFAEDFSTYTEANATWTPLSEYLYAADVFIRTEQTPAGENKTLFVGCIDDQWLVMISVDQIPAELKEGVDLTNYV